MTSETPAETQHIGSHLPMADSDSDEDAECIQEAQPVTPWDDLPIVERVGLNIMQMSEEEIESAYCQITLAFRTDQYTLKQRLQAEEHARNLAEENVQLELSRGRETLETLKGLCLDIRRSTILQRLELSLDILGGTVGRISNTAEVLGSVHQEARICRAVEIMATHVENLKRRHERDGLELEQSKKLVHRISRRNLNDPGTLPDVDEVELQKQDKNAFQQYNSRRRVSTSIITKETQERRKRELRKQVSLGDGCWLSQSSGSESSWPAMTRHDTCSHLPGLDGRPLVDAKDTPLEASVVRPGPDPSPLPDPEESPPPPPPIPPPPPPPAPPAEEEEVAKATRSKSGVPDSLRQRQRSRAAPSKRKGDKDKKSVSHFRASISSQSSALRPFPLTHWLFRSRWAILFLALLLILCAATLTLCA